MNREQLIREVGGKILTPIGLIQGVFILLFFTSPIIWIWSNWSLAWKFGLTGLIGTFILYYIYAQVKRIISKAVDSFLKDKRIS